MSKTNSIGISSIINDELEWTYSLEGILSIINDCELDSTNIKKEEDFSNKDWILRMSYLLTKQVTNHEIILFLLIKQVIKREYENYFKNAVRFIYDSIYYNALLDNHIVTKQDDEELFSEIVDKILKDKNRCTYLIRSGILTKKNNYDTFTNLYKILMNKEQKHRNYNVKSHLTNYNILKEDKELFELTILSAISEEMNAFNILKEKIVTKEDSSYLFTQTVNAIKKPQLRANLVKCGIIPEE